MFLHSACCHLFHSLKSLNQICRPFSVIRSQIEKITFLLLFSFRCNLTVDNINIPPINPSVFPSLNLLWLD